MTKYYLNGPYRCTKCYQLKASVTSDSDYCQECLEILKKQNTETVAEETDLQIESLWDSICTAINKLVV